MDYIAFCVKGLEKIVASELAETIDDIDIRRVDNKKIIFKSNQEPRNFLRLKTPDDVCLLLNNTKTENNPTAAEIFSSVNNLDLEKPQSVIRNLRDLDTTFSITLATYKNTEVDRNDLQGSLVRHIENKYGWQFTPRNHDNFDLRIIAGSDNYLVALRITPKPMYYRDYRKRSQKGALRPTIAAAMLRLLNPEYKASERLVDNCCGSGTFLCEAALADIQVYGGDIQNQSVKAARFNLSTINQAFANNIKVLDASKATWRDNYFNFTISNLPWGKQISVNLTTFYEEIIKQYKRILKNNGNICLLAKKPQFIKKALSENFPDKVIRSQTIGYLGQNPTILWTE